MTVQSIDRVIRASNPGSWDRGMTPVVFFINGIGDYILNLPAFRALAAWSEGQLTVISSDRPASRVLDELDARLVRVPHRRAATGKEFDWRLAVDAVGPCDLFVSLAPWSSESLRELVVALKPRLSVGFGDLGLPAFDVQVPLDFTKHSARLAFDIVNVLWPEADLSAFVAQPTFGEGAARFVQNMMADLPAGARCLCVHGETLAPKMWSPERFSTVLTSFLSERPEYFCFLVGTSDIGIACPGFEDRVVRTFVPTSERADRTNCLPLAVAQSLVAAADLFVGVDSCFLHVADFCRVPTVALFGPTSPHEFGCLLTDNHTLWGAGGTMDGLQVAEVLEAIEQMADIGAASPRRPEADVDLVLPRSLNQAGSR